MIRTAIFKHLVVGTWQQGTLLIMRRNIIYLAILEHNVYISQGFLKKENQWDICVYIKRFFFKELALQLWELESLKSIQQGSPKSLR